MDDRLATLEQLYHRTGPRLLRYLQRHVSDSAVAEDLLQETFVVAAQQYDKLAAARSHEAWLIGIARNLARTHRRRMLLRTTVSLSAELTQQKAQNDDARLEEMQATIERLPEPQREALQLRLCEGLSYAEIAEVLDVPIGTVRSRIHHAVAALREWATEIRRSPQTRG